MTTEAIELTITSHELAEYMETLGAIDRLFNRLAVASFVAITGPARQRDAVARAYRAGRRQIERIRADHPRIVPDDRQIFAALWHKIDKNKKTVRKNMKFYAK